MRNESPWVLRNARGRERSVRVGGHFESDDIAVLRAAVYGGVPCFFFSSTESVRILRTTFNRLCERK
jgi:hypothetical protein